VFLLPTLDASLRILLVLFFFFYCYRLHRDLHSFPTRRSSDLSLRVLSGVGGWVSGIQITAGTRPRPASRPALRRAGPRAGRCLRSEEHTSELQSHLKIVCRLLLEKKKKKTTRTFTRYHL